MPLDETGLRQSQLVAERFTDLDAVYSSDLVRSMQTAEAIAASVGAEIKATSALREAFFGDWEGLTRAELESMHGEGYEAYKKDPMPFAPPGGERICDMRARVVAELDRIAAAHEGTVVVVTHGGPIKAIATHLLLGTSRTFHLLRTDNTGVTLLHNAATVAFWNDTHHLGADGLSGRVTDALLRGRF